jgi:hypothetical protein
VPAHLHALDDGWHEWDDDGDDEDCRGDHGAGDGPPVRVRVRVGEGDDGRLHLVEMHLDGILSAEALRSIPVGRIEAAANAQLHPTATGAGGDVDVPAGAPSTLRDDLRETAVPGYPDAFYVAVAAVYRRLAATSPRPVADLARDNAVPVTTAQRWVKEARRRGMLAPGRPGKAG